MYAIEDPKLEIQFLSSLADLSLTDIDECKRVIESKGVTEVDFSREDNWHGYCGLVKCVSHNLPCTPTNLTREIAGYCDRSIPIAQTIVSGDGNGYAVDGYCDRLLEVSERRQALRQLEDARERILQGREAASSIKFKLSNSLSRTRGRISTKGLDEYVNELEAHIDDVRNGRVKPITPFYIPALDRALGGLQNTLIMVGAEPGVGKSALLASLVNLQAQNGHKPFVASLEDEPGWLAYRLVANDSKINQTDLRFTKLGSSAFEALKNNNAKLADLRKNIRTVDGSISGLRIEDLISSINDAIVNEGCDSVWIDHAGEILLQNTERTDLEIARHLSLLRGVANKHGVPVVVCAHLKRPVDPSAPPSFRDFANSAGAERKARVALGLRRSPGSDVLSIHILKQTNGPSGQVIDLNFHGAAAMVMETEGGIR